MYGGLRATIYGLFMGYLNVPAHTYATVKLIMLFPWSFKAAIGCLSDVQPLLSYHRKPYMVLGWAWCTIVLVAQALGSPLPDPYWCRESGTGRANTTAPPCNPAARDAGGWYALVLMLAAWGFLVADVAADGLTLEYGRREPEHRRGRTQTSAYIARRFGGMAGTLVVGVGFNSVEYSGTFEWGLSFHEVCGLLGGLSALMVPVSWYLVEEARVAAPGGRSCGADRALRKHYARVSWSLVCSKAFLAVVVYQFAAGLTLQLQTPAVGEIKRYWAGVRSLQNAVFALLGDGVFVLGLALVRRYLLQASWRRMLLLTAVAMQIVDMPFQLLTVFGVVRDPYFYLGEAFALEIPEAANFVVATFVMVELADDCNAGLVHGLLATANNVGQPLGRALGRRTNTFFVRSGIADTRSVLPRRAIHSSLVLCESYKTHQSDLRSDSPNFRCI